MRYMFSAKQWGWAVLLAMVWPPFVGAEEIDVKEKAKGLAETLKDTLETIFPVLGRKIAGVDVKISREVEIEKISYDTESGKVALKAEVHYYTSDAAVINMAGLGISVRTHFDTEYNLQTGDLSKIKVSFDLPKGWGSVDCNLTPIKKVLEGDIAAAVELIPNGGLVKMQDLVRLRRTEEMVSGQVWQREYLLRELGLRALGEPRDCREMGGDARRVGGILGFRHRGRGEVRDPQGTRAHHCVAQVARCHLSQRDRRGFRHGSTNLAAGIEARLATGDA